MVHGFAIAIFPHESGSVLKEQAGDRSKNGYLIYHPAPGVVVCKQAASRPDFVEVCCVGNWVMASIGRCFSGESLALKLRLESEEIDVISLSNWCEKALGQYCVVFFNHNTGDLLQVTDPSGVRSLFTFSHEGSIFISSNLHMLRQLVPKHIIQPNIENQSFLFRYAYSLPTHTIFNEVYEMVPGQIAIKNLWSENKTTIHLSNTSNNIEAYGWDSDKNTGSYECNNEKALYARLLFACRQQLGNAKKVGVLLGGVDSALVASLLVQLGAHVETYSFHYSNEHYNQPHTDMLAETLGITHHRIEINPRIIKDGLESYDKNCSWPTLWLSYILQTQYVCVRMVADGMDTCFSGDGCDTIFLGYPNTYRRGRVYQEIPRINTHVSKVIKFIFHSFGMEYVFGHVGRAMMSLVDASTYNVSDRPFYSFQIFDSESYRRLTNIKAKKYNSHEEYFKKSVQDTTDQSYERMMYLSKSFVSPNRCKLASSSDMSGMLINSPYFHSSVINFAKNLPNEDLRPVQTAHAKDGKHLLLKMAESHSLLPREIIYQPKLAAVKSPVDSWLATELRSYALSKLSSLPFDYNKRYVKSLLSEQFVEKLYKNYFSSDEVVSLASSLLLTYAAFFESVD